ncbi:MAG: lipase family protein [Planctomycetes bacterium]|nr:lipase family protein [Planctomycetota bacterium]
MEFSLDPDALFKPGEAEDFFVAKREGVTLRGTGRGFSYVNAWWLAELCRLIYRQDASEGVARGPLEPTRAELLERVGLRERFFFHEGDLCQGALVEPIATPDAWTALVFRGTHSPQNWLTNTNAVLGAWPKGGQVHVGFRDALLGQWARIEQALHAARGPMFFTGHSLGGAFATLAASLLAPHALYTFGAPRVGNAAFGKSLQRTAFYRVVNNRDAVTSLPLPFPTLGFTHVGELRYFDRDGCPREDPGDLSVVWDRIRWEAPTDPAGNSRGFTDLPKFMTDHAPINYVALLARYLPTRRQ